MDSEVAQLRRELDNLRQEFRREIAELKAQHANELESLRERRQQMPSAENSGDRWPRRALLLGGAGAVAAAATGVAAAPPATAAINAMFTGALNNGGADPTALISNSANRTFLIENNGTGLGLQVRSFTQVGVATQSDSGAGLFAVSDTGPAVYAMSRSGPAIRLVAAGNVPPTSGTWDSGDLQLSGSGELWFCVSGGTPGSWRLLASNGSAGAYVPITPVRVYDSRNAQPSAGQPLLAGTDRVISVKDARNLTTGAVESLNIVPAGTKAITVNLTVATLSGPGFLAVAPGVALTFSASAINWTAAGQIIANGLTIPVDANRAIKAFCRSAATHFIVDVTGYFRAA